MAALHSTANTIKIHKLWKNNHEEEKVPLSRSRSTDLQLQVWSNLSISTKSNHTRAQVFPTSRLSPTTERLSQVRPRQTNDELLLAM